MVDRTTERAQSSKAKKIPGAFPNPDLKCYMYNQKKKKLLHLKKNQVPPNRLLGLSIFFSLLNLIMFAQILKHTSDPAPDFPYHSS